MQVARVARLTTAPASASPRPQARSHCRPATRTYRIAAKADGEQEGEQASGPGPVLSGTLGLLALTGVVGLANTIQEQSPGSLSSAAAVAAGAAAAASSVVGGESRAIGIALLGVAGVAATVAVSQARGLKPSNGTAPPVQQELWQPQDRSVSPPPAGHSPAAAAPSGRSELEMLGAEVAALQQTQRELQQQMKDAQEARDLQQQLAEQLAVQQATTSEVQEQLQSLQSELRQQQSIVEKLQDELAREAAERAALEEQLDEAVKKTVFLEAQLKAETEQRERLQQLSTRLDEELALARVEADKTISELQAKAAQQAAALQSQASALQADLEGSRREAVDTREQLQQSQQESAQFKALLEQSVREAAELRSLLEQSEREADELRALLEASRSRSALLEQAWAEAMQVRSGGMAALQQRDSEGVA